MADLHLDQMDPGDYEALVIPGGEPYPLFENQSLIQLIRSFHEQNKLIAAICAGPSEVLRQPGCISVEEVDPLLYFKQVSMK